MSITRPLPDGNPCSIGDGALGITELVGGPFDGDLIGYPFCLGDRNGVITVICPHPDRSALILRNHQIRPNDATRADYTKSEFAWFEDEDGEPIPGPTDELLRRLGVDKGAR